MIKKIVILTFFTLIGIFLYEYQQFLIQKNFQLDRKINKYNTYINKMREVSKINSKLFSIVNKDNIKIFDKEKAEEKIVKIFDKYKDIFGFKIENYGFDNNRIFMNIKMEKYLKSYKDIKNIADFYEKNSLENALITYKEFNYIPGEIKSNFELSIIYRNNK
ncbi:hypothetical protein [Nitrosophilus kaiyonis]|uniref:hypothetical protein n=1 Tax=Nitrosophilus kaiyonis TaxID=2930200 RepID=UPI00248FEF10|nr:hypothetical protein [Nitrosophilus kaiyonis]